MKFFLCLLALAIASVNASLLRGGLVGGAYLGAPAVYGAGHGSYVESRLIREEIPVIRETIPVIRRVAPVVRLASAVVRVAPVVPISYRAVHAPSVVKVISAGPAHGAWLKN